MTVSCIIPTYRKFDYLNASIKSVLNQTYPSIELIITDDGSSNIDVDEISQYVEQNKKENLVKYAIITHDANVGTVRNMNSAIEVATGEIIIPLASDDIFYSDDVIEKIVNKFQETNCDILSCSRMKCSEDMKQEYRLMPHPGYRKYIQKKMGTAENQYVHMALGASMEFASGATLYYRRAVFIRVGKYDESYKLWEDGPFIAKVTRNGIKIETAYDIVSIRYRDGGISSKKSKNSQKSLIEYDYINAISREYLEYSDRFNGLQKRIVKGRKIIQNDGGHIGVKHIIVCPSAVIYTFGIKVRKALLRLY